MTNIQKFYMVLRIAFTRFVWISEQTATSGLSHVNRLFL